VTGNTVSSEPPSVHSVLSRIEEEIARLSKTKSGILQEKTGLASIAALAIAIILNIAGITTQTTTYMLLWISASLYFYLFYPMLPIFIFPFRYILNIRGGHKEEKKKESVIIWAKKIHIIKNRRVGFRLFLRFFILSLLPLTIGMLCIYFISMVYSIMLGYMGEIPADTAQLIFIQCIGIVLFYIEIFFFRHHLFNFTQYIRKQGGRNAKRVIILLVLGGFFVIIGSIVVILLLIAILLPGFTLASFINVSEFVKVRTNLWVVLLLASQVIIMQFLQHVLSLKIGRDMCDDLMIRLQKEKEKLSSGTHRTAKESRYDNRQTVIHQIKEPLILLKEIGLYAINRRKMFGLFPTYSIGINIPSLFNIQDLGELKEVFSKNE
jgi:hypothetical protein